MLPLLIAIPGLSAVAPQPPVPPLERRLAGQPGEASGTRNSEPESVVPLQSRWALDPDGISSHSSIALADQANNRSIPDRPALAYPYISLQGGLSFPDSLNGLDRTAGQSPAFRFNSGGSMEVAVGYQFPNHTRLEVSAGYLAATPSSLTLYNQNVPMATVETDGELRLFTTTFNGIIEFPLRDRNGRIERMIPYLGAGIGYGNLSVPHCAITSKTCLMVNPVSTMVYQFKAGISYKAAARTSLFLEGGYVGTLDTTFSNDNGDITYNRVGAMRLNLGLRLGF